MPNLPDYIEIRSFLMENVDIILENLSARRETKKNTSEDIFSFFDDTMDSSNDKINWRPVSKVKSKLEILKQEKSALGVYMTGKPLEDYQESIEYFRQITGLGDNLQLIVIDKVKKIFTKANAMMFALQLSMLDQEIEGVIFSKKAMVYSPILAENELFWVIGHVDDKSKKETIPKLEGKIEEKTEIKQNEVAIDKFTDPELEPENHTVEYVEKPKFIINHICPVELGILELLKTSDTIPNQDFIELFPKINWNLYKTNPEKITLDIDLVQFLENKYTYKKLKFGGKNPNWKGGGDWKKSTEVAVNSNKKDILKTKVTLFKSLGGGIKTIKDTIKKEYFQGSIPIELWIETGEGEIKKVKGNFWMPKDLLKK